MSPLIEIVEDFPDEARDPEQNLIASAYEILVCLSQCMVVDSEPVFLFFHNTPLWHLKPPSDEDYSPVWLVIKSIGDRVTKSTPLPLTRTE